MTLPAGNPVTTVACSSLSHLDEQSPRKPSDQWGQLSHWVTVHWLPLLLASSWRRAELFICMSLPLTSQQGLASVSSEMEAQGISVNASVSSLDFPSFPPCATLTPATMSPSVLYSLLSAYSPRCPLTTSCEVLWLITKPKRGRGKSPTAKQKGRTSPSLSSCSGPPDPRDTSFSFMTWFPMLLPPHTLVLFLLLPIS